MTPKAVHQFSIACAPGDGITNGMLLTQRLLRAAGIASEIYCEDIHTELANRIKPLNSYRTDPDQVLLIHHGIGNGQESWLKQLKDRRFMVFHNITPASFFADNHPIQPMLAHGWQQLKEWQSWLCGAIADSQQNYRLLLEHGYAAEKCADIPLLVDLDLFRQARPQDSCRSLNDCFSLLFVGRLMPHKNQHGLIDTLYHLRCMTRQNVRLTLVGSTDDRDYVSRLQQQIKQLGLQHAVNLTGKISNEELNRHYQQADLYVSLSRHEGFGMPLIEAMSQRLPVLAYSCTDSNVEHTVGRGGLLLQTDEPQACAATIAQLMANPRLRTQLVRQGIKHLDNYQPQSLYAELQAFMARFGIQLPDATLPDTRMPPLKYRIEGPFDSSYSLAIVNRQLALALDKLYPGRVGLHSTEGHGDFEPNPQFLTANPNCARLLRIGQEHTQTEGCLRLLYPPRVTGMKGQNNGLGCYGWEESSLPSEYVDNFNQHLQFATTMSNYVTRTMIDNGVSCPLFTTGIGVDHILEAEPDAGQLPALPNKLRILHISSCFPRKGVDCLLKAYGDAFTAADDVTLIIKTFPNPHHDIEQQLADWRGRLASPPPVILINKDLDDGAIRALYQAADLLVAPSRGEGFGLPMAEAMLHRLPVITTGFGGQRDFCTDDTSWLIDYSFARADTHMGQTTSVWVEPDAEHLSQLLSEFYQQRQRGSWDHFVATKLDSAHHLISKRYSWRAVAERLDRSLATLQQLPPLEPALRFGSVTTWNSKCGIATYSKMLLQPALSEALIFANDDVELTDVDGSNVQRCWTAGQEDSLERLEQAIVTAGIEQLLIQFNFSFFNLRSLKKLLSRLHQRQIQVMVTFHSTADVYWGEELKTLRDLLPELARVSRIFVHGTEDLNRLKTFGLVDNTTLFPHGVSRHQPHLLKPTQIPAILQGKTVIASYGFLLPHKGIRQLIEAFCLLKEQCPQAHLLLVNAEYPVDISEQEAQDCQALIHSLGLQQQVTLITDYLEDEQSLGWLSLADCIVFPYQHTQESSSAAVRWGLATERPVFCTPLPIFEDVASAVQFLPGTSPAEIAEGLSKALQDPARLAAMHEQQKNWLKQHAWPQLSKRLKNLLNALTIERIKNDWEPKKQAPLAVETMD